MQQIRKFKGTLIVGILLIFLCLTACQNIRNKVICPLVGQEGTCRIKGNESAGTNESEYAAVSLSNQVGIFTNPFSSSNEPEYQIITGTGIQPYPVNYTVLVTQAMLDFKTEENSVVDCGSYGTDRCRGTLEDVTLEYTVNGQKFTRLIGVEINGTLTQLVVNQDTLPMWRTLIQANTELNVNGAGIIFDKFWTIFRTEARFINIGDFDPIDDQWGGATADRIAEAMMEKFNLEFPYAGIATIERLSIRHLYPNNDAGGGSARSEDNQHNPSVVATNDAVSVHQAEILATQIAVVCGEISDSIAKALCIQAVVDRLNGQSDGSSSPVIVVTPNPIPTQGQ